MSNAQDDYYERYYGTSSEPYVITHVECTTSWRDKCGKTYYTIYYRTAKRRVRNSIYARDELEAFTEGMKLMATCRAKAKYWYDRKEKK